MAAHSSILTWRIHGQRSLVGYSSWGGKESDTMSMHAHTHTYTHTHTSEIMGHMALVVKNQSANAGEVSTLAWRIPCTEKPGRLRSIG